MLYLLTKLNLIKIIALVNTLSCIAVVGVVAVEGEGEGDSFAISKPMTTLWHCYGIAILMLKKNGAELKQTRELKNN